MKTAEDLLKIKEQQLQIIAKNYNNKKVCKSIIDELQAMIEENPSAAFYKIHLNKHLKYRDKQYTQFNNEAMPYLKSLGYSITFVPPPFAISRSEFDGATISIHLNTKED